MRSILLVSLVFTALSGCAFDLAPLHGTHHDTGIVGDGGIGGDTGPFGDSGPLPDTDAGTDGGHGRDSGTICCASPRQTCGTSADCCGGVSCVSGVCGAREGESCRDTNDCSGDLICTGENLTVAPGTCEARSDANMNLDCGREGQPCCNGLNFTNRYQCEQGTVCAGMPGNPIVSCVPCGDLGQIKCSGAAPCQPGLAPDAFSICQTAGSC